METEWEKIRMELGMEYKVGKVNHITTWKLYFVSK